MPKQYRYLSADSHLEVDSKGWIPRVPEKHRHFAPYIEPMPNGGDAWIMDGKKVAEANSFDLYGGKGRDVWLPAGANYWSTPGTGPATQRIQEQDTDGIDGEVLFPAQVNGPKLWRKIPDDDAYRSVVRAYNDWMAEEYCATAPDRLLGVGVIPWTGVDDAIAEMRHCKEQGLRIVVLGVFPSGKGYPSPEDDRFWAASLDMQMPVAIHVDLDRSGERGGPLYRYQREPEELKSRLDTPVGGIVGQTARFARAAGLNAVQLTLDHLFDRFPSLKVYLAENSIGWVPFFLNMADIRYGRHRWWAEKELEWKPLDRKPSEVIRDQFYWGFQEDPIGVELRRHLNINQIVWGTDFPHQESEFPNSMGVVERNFAGVPAEEKRKMVAGNIIEFLHLDAVAVAAEPAGRTAAAD
jgi:predicted TIM-barrel fold metal-dependent hydrolase